MKDLTISLMDWHYVQHGRTQFVPSPAEGSLARIEAGTPRPGDRMPIRPQMPYGIRITPETAEVSARWIAADRPWERQCAWVTVLHEPPLYRCWYVNVLPPEEDGGPTETDREANAHFGPTSGKYVLCYAESRDGWTWEKPQLGLYSFHGSTANNITCPYGKETAITRDPRAPEEARYKAFHFARLPGIPDGPPPENKTIYECSGLYALTSPDGLRWTRHPEPVIRYFCDTENTVTWDPFLEKYVGYFRGHFFAGRRPEGGHDGRGIRFAYGGRAIARAETDDFLKWPQPRVILTPGPQDGPADDYYSNGFTWHPDDPTLRLMFSSIYHRDRDDTSIRLAVSRDGQAFNWLSMDPVIARGTPESPAWGGGYVGPNLLYLPDGRMAVPLRASAKPHNEHGKGRGGGFCWALWESGRVAGIEAPARGECFLLPLTFEGEAIEINARTGCGGTVETEVWVRTPEGRAEPVPGYLFEDNIPFRGDAVWAPCQWRDGRTTEALRGRDIELRFRLSAAKLFAIRFRGNDT